ncbi:MAG: hypothetical protein LBE13_16745 [Bacteroidales bacterium]|jgi:RHS repeat-associated protein|nr:hypothetical protein [Bacteroidales bacterium]
MRNKQYITDIKVSSRRDLADEYRSPFHKLKLAAVEMTHSPALGAYGYIDCMSMNYGNSNQLRNISNSGTNVLTNPSDFKDYKKGGEVEYTYNANGGMTQYLNKGISAIRYNRLNLLEQIDIKNPVAETRNEYTYTVTGAKLKVVHRRNPAYSNNPVIGSDVSSGSLTEKATVDYVGNKIYKNGALEKILTENGYYENGKYYFYIRDHLGSNRIVADQSGIVEQSTQYYPFGMVMEETGREKQAFKFGGKEEETMHGLNLYDFEARQLDKVIPRFTTMDPLATGYYSVSPYALWLNNPLRVVDPDGMDVLEINSQGKIVNRIKDETQDDFYIVDKDADGNYRRIYKTDNNGNTILDENGNPVFNSISFDYGTVSDVRMQTVNMNEHSNVTQAKLTIFEVKGDNNATQLFEFLGNTGVTTNVEWSHIQIGYENSGRNIVGSTENGYNFSAINDYVLQTGYTIRQDNHSHVYSSHVSDADKNHAGRVHRKFPNVKLNNYYKGIYTPYNSKGAIKK